MGKPCAQCGNELDEGARVCTRCGTPVAGRPAPTAAQTMIGFSSPFAPSAARPQPQPQPQPPAPQPQAPQPQPQPPAPMQAGLAKTMLGFSAPDVRSAVPSPAAAPPQHAPPSSFAAGAKTMLGVPAPTPPLGAPPPAAAPATPPKSSFGGTMLGVAMPGIAPAHSQPGVAPPPAGSPAGVAARPAAQIPVQTMVLEQAPPVLPAPAPFVREAAPAAPVVVARRGLPLAVVAVLVSFLVLAGGGAILYFSRAGGPPLAATAKVSAEGKEQLHLECQSCPDGTKASSSGASATFAHHAADLDLPAPLAIGDNKFDIALDRPGTGRDEAIKLVLPLAYRIRGDLSGIGATPPVIRVDVEAQRGAQVTVDGNPVTLDSAGKATLSYDVTSDTSGALDETRTIERKIPYEVVGIDHKKGSGEVSVRVAVLPLHIDAPTAALVTDASSVWVAGKTSKGAVVTCGATSLPVGPDGSFEGRVDVAQGDQTLTLRAAAAGDAAARAAPRTATVAVRRVASLDAEAKNLDQAASIDFSAVAADPAAAAGKSISINGRVIDARSAHHRAALLVDDLSCSRRPACGGSVNRGCAKGPRPQSGANGPCIIRVDYGGDLDVQAGDNVSAYGIIAKPITTPDGKTVPAVDATLVRKGKP